MGRAALFGRWGRYTFVSASVEPDSYWSLTPWRRNDPILTSLAGIFRASDFPAPQPGQNGHLVRNAYRGPGDADVSLSVSKKLQMTARVTAEFRVDAFNALNRVNLSDPVTDLSNSNFGKVMSQLNTRAIQLGARLRF
jgi:hypothetical protein